MRNLSKSSIALACSALLALAAPAAMAEPNLLAESLVGAGQFGDPGPAAGHAAVRSVKASTTAKTSKSARAAKSAKSVKSAKPAHTAGASANATDNSSAADAGGDPGAPRGSNFFRGAASPLAGGVTVIDHVNPGGMRLKRATLPIGIDSNGNHGEPVANSHELPLTGSINDEGTKFQSLFPSLDSFGDPGRTLSGNAQQDKPLAQPQGHPIWQKSPLGGYYDASGSTHDVVKGNQLYKYGGTMADGLTPAPSGPVEQNSMGYIRWQPMHGGPPGYY